jgi:catechol 2,3-dioxygenase-like lactoylglutathione lyase family enzyme
MPDRATPNLPSRDLAATSRFYARLGFRESFRNDGWLILERGPVQLEFFLHAALDPLANIASCCIRVADASALHAAFAAADLPPSAHAMPRLTAPADRPWGFREFALVDPDGNLLRCLAPLGGTLPATSARP